MADNFTKVGKDIFIILILLSTGITLGDYRGKQVTEAKYQKNLLEMKKRISDAKDEVKTMEIKHARKIQKFEDELKRVENEHSDAVNRLNSEHNDRVRQLNGRIEYYRDLRDGATLQEATTCRIDELARVTEDLDRNTVSGIRVVGELRAAAQRVNKELSTLMKIIQQDRELINE